MQEFQLKNDHLQNIYLFPNLGIQNVCGWGRGVEVGVSLRRLDNISIESPQK